MIVINSKILLVEDDIDILIGNSVYLKSLNYDIFEATTAKKAYEVFLDQNPDLIVLDIQLPDGSGIDLCSKIREISATPIIFLTGILDEDVVVKGLMAGGDNYITKPYSLSEFGAKIYSVLRRITLDNTKKYYFPPIKIDTVAGRIYYEEEDLVLTAKEFQVLLLLIKNIGKCVSSSEIYENVWALSPEQTANTVAVHISSIRKKLRIDDKTSCQISNIKNRGYSFTYNNHKLI